MLKFFIDQASTIKSDTWKEFPDGRLIVPATLTRTGVFKYRYEDIFGNTENPEFPRSMFQDGIIKVYRSYDEVLKSIESMKGMYFCDEHPEEDVTSENWKVLSKGQFSTEVAIREKNYEGFSIHYFDSLATIIDPSVKQLIKTKVKDQISLGYSGNLLYLPGTFGNQNYHFSQINIENNHGALVKRGRAGSSVKIKSRFGDLDTVYQIEESNNFIKNKEETKFIMDLRGIKINFSDSNSETIIQQELDSKNTEIKNIQAKVKLTDTLEARVLKLEKDLQDAQSIDVEAVAQERLNIVSKAKHYLKDSDFKGVSNNEIMKQTVSAFYKGKDLTGKSEGFFKDSFELLDDKPSVTTAKGNIRDSFSSNRPPSTNFQDSDNDGTNELLSMISGAFDKASK